MVKLAGLVLLLIAGAVWAQEDRGAQLYQSQCSYCHGRDGEGGRGPSLQRAVLRHAPDEEALARVVRRGLPGLGMPGTTMSDREAEAVAAHVRRLGRVPAAVVAGDRTRGEQLYSGSKGRCGSCHMVGGRGGTFGPDLSAIGLRRSPQHLRASLTDPAADRPDGFVRVNLTTRGGRKVSGARINEDSFSIQVRDLAGRMHSFWKSELADLKKDLTSSPMPGYGSVFSSGDLDDLVAYLASLREER